MKDKIMACMERIRLVKRVQAGIISYEQIDQICALHNLNEEQKKTVLNRLNCEGITPVFECDFPEKLQKLRRFACEEAGTCKKQLPPQQAAGVFSACSQTPFERSFERYKEVVRRKPSLLRQFRFELLVFIIAYLMKDAQEYQTVYEQIGDAAMAVSRYRLDRRGYVPACGTHAKKQQDFFERWLRFVYTEDTLATIMECFRKGGPFTAEQIHMVEVLIFHIPTLYGRSRRLKDFLD